MANKINIPLECPKCKETSREPITTANSHKEIEEKFGYRNMDNKKEVRPQSWCKECRKQYS